MTQPVTEAATFDSDTKVAVLLFGDLASIYMHT